MSRKLYYLPTHIKDRVESYRKRNDMIDENEAIIRLLSEALDLEEVERVEHKEEPKETVSEVVNEFPVPVTMDQWQNLWDYWFRLK